MKYIVDRIENNIVVLENQDTKEIINIEIMSNDKLTVYQTINPNFEIGKKYKIDVRVYVIKHVVFCIINNL